MKSSWLLSLALVMTISSLLAAAASVSSEIYDNRGTKLNGVGGEEELNAEKADKRTFFVGSRYGRSQSDPMNMESKSSGVRIVPRNDRYFFGSRYGKRSMLPPLMSDDQSQAQLQCFYTGIANLFRCVERSTEEMK